MGPGLMIMCIISLPTATRPAIIVRVPLERYPPSCELPDRFLIEAILDLPTEES